MEKYFVSMVFDPPAVLLFIVFLAIIARYIIGFILAILNVWSVIDANL